MKKLLLIHLLLLSITSFSQTPIYKYDFDGDMNNSGSATIGPWVPNGTGSVAYVTNRLGEPNKAINIPNTLGYNIDILGNSVMPSGNSARTLSFWVKFVNDNDNKSYPVVGWGAASPNQAFGFWRTGVQNSYYTIGNDYNVPQTNAQIQATNSGWVHIAMTHTGTTLSIFYNGVDAGNYPRTLNTVNQIFKLNRLVNSANGGTGDAIQLDDLRIYNTALTASQIQDIYNQTTTTGPSISNVSATNIGNNSATINYTINANNAATTTEVRYAVSPGGTLQIQAGPSATGTVNTPLSVNLSGLSPNTTYEYNVWASNSQGTNFLAASLFFTTTGSTAPPVLTAVNESNITNVSASINFSLNTGGIATPTTVNYGTSSSALTSSVSGPVVTSSTATPNTINLTGLSANTTYYYQVVATNTNGITSSSVDSFTTLATAPAPTPIYHFPFNGSLTATDGVTTMNYEPSSGQFAFVIGNTALAFINNSNITPNFSAILPNLPQGNSARTVSIRLNFDINSLSQSNNVFVWGTPVANQAYGWSQSSTVQANNYFWGSGDFLFTNPMSTGTWYIMTFVFDGTFAKVYRDGVLVANVSKTLNTTGTNFWLGSVLGGGLNFFNGFIDDLQIYNTALTDSQITALNSSILSSEDFSTSKLNFSIYPNPATELVNIVVETELKSVAIISIHGQKVLETTNNVVNIAGLPAGIYFVKAQDVNGAVATQKLVVR